MSTPLIFTAVSSLPNDSIVDVVVIHKEPVDESHIEVQKLIDADYPEEESIRAIERWGTAREAITKLMCEHDSEEIPVENEEIPVQPKTNTSVCIYIYMVHKFVLPYVPLKFGIICDIVTPVHS